jgi:hypothetical protein
MHWKTPLAVAKNHTSNRRKTHMENRVSSRVQRVMGRTGSRGSGLRVFPRNPLEPPKIAPDFTIEGSGHTGSPGFIGFGSQVVGLGSTDSRPTGRIGWNLCPRHLSTRESVSIYNAPNLSQQIRK